VNGISVRRLTESDDLTPAGELLVRFFAEEGFTTPPATIGANTQRLASLDTCGLFIAEAEARAIGVATISLEFGIEYGWSAEMGDLYVLPEWRGRGVSAKIVAAIEAFLKERGAAGYQVTVTDHAETHHGLAAFYRKLGFAGEGRKLLYKSLKD
jgi:aminoglycoside 6'-N-acetyltransferase I